MPLIPLTPATFPALVDGFLTTLAENYTAASGTMTVTSATALPSGSISPGIVFTVWHVSSNVTSHYLVTHVSGNVLTVAVTDGYTDVDFFSGDPVASTVSYERFRELQAAVSTDETLINEIVTVANLSANLVPTPIKTAAYPAVVGDLVLTNATAASVPITLPTEPADGSIIGVKMIATTLGTYITSVTCGGADVINIAGGGTTYNLKLVDQGVTFQYQASSGVWIIKSDDLPLGQLDIRYLQPTGSGASLTGITGSQITGNISGDAAGLTSPIAQSQVTGLAASLASLQPAISLTTTGTSGAATFASNVLNIPNYAGQTYTAGTGLGLSGGAFSIATTAVTAGSYGSSTSIPGFTVNAEGQLTAAAGNVVVAPAGTLTGTALATNVVTSSLTAVGTITTGVWNGTPLTTSYLPTSAVTPGSYTLSNITVDAYGRITAAASGSSSSGTVTSVALTTPGVLFSVAGSPVTTSGTLAMSLVTQTANTVLAGPTTGSAATPTMRALVAADIPNHSAALLTSGNVALAQLGTGTAAAGKYVDGASGAWTALPSAGANALGTYLVQTATNDPTNAQVLASLATGLMKVTTSTGVVSTAVAGTDYVAPGGVSGGQTINGDTASGGNLTLISTSHATKGSIIAGPLSLSPSGSWEFNAQYYIQPCNTSSTGSPVGVGGNCVISGYNPGGTFLANAVLIGGTTGGGSFASVLTVWGQGSVLVQGYTAAVTPLMACGATSQTNPLFVLQQKSSTSTARNCGIIDATFKTQTDASWTGILSLYAGDYTSTNTGKQLGIQIQSNGSVAQVGLFGTAPASQPVLSYSRTTAGETPAVAAIRAALASLGIVLDSTTT